ncbi:hypothetical protein BCR33DRAFT_721279 [Rhizoclosmatium globosum]|uniref:Uncharacterized protein n=1 Tax=Rhizoclosmatium globosum TaxID=329046 RepID=A0A1Y2BUJ2_9FUNG|nr:hypothetical protein BCR33DRAFT_721279 [Rhizoclosmatium globosum]|eukprot:ORY37785.1 hypothetical protein BCR33DRAFT_721279 [Rhizoclosmatium globosum]
MVWSKPCSIPTTPQWLEPRSSTATIYTILQIPIHTHLMIVTPYNQTNEEQNSCKLTRYYEGDIESMVEDPDLMPTMDDWLLIANRNAVVGPVKFAIDGDNLLANYFHLPPVLRLTASALAADTHSPPLPEQISLSYYRRARKAIIRAIEDVPTYQTVQAYYYLYLFSVCKFSLINGEEALGTYSVCREGATSCRQEVSESFAGIDS